MSLSARYSTLEKIGEGSFSEVNKIHDRYSKRCYAAKVLKEKFDSIEAAMCCNEIIALRALQHHPNVAGITDFFYDAQTRKLTIITELAQMNLYEYIKDRKRCLSEIRCKHFLYQLVSGLRYLHGREIFHRDIKPENCLVKIDKRLGVNPIQAEILQLTDFGMVCNFNDKPPLSSYISTRWYRAPEVMLTYGYYGPPVDIWALGCIFYEILTLKPLFPGENQTDQLNKIHSALGSPSKDVLRRLKHLDSSVVFQAKKGTGLHSLAMLSGDGMDIWRKMLEYRADLRINAFQMFEHSYFDSLRSSKSKSMILHEDRILGKAKSNICLSRKLQASETKMKERLWGMNSGSRTKMMLNMARKSST
ncbi:MAPK/MAK/MRK overlapping kinase-like isoform X2 [Bradysia coprophila]|uniref:MAPK/MAK/MRK overlapping kinase-like isoform X2 n=1 Tax=Bradysia coprophila TaxID=38358 RepID=UPI00187DAE6B|nr:MAPK/MAK/MRK overlapping kinase-like isoform X2 [Bradysia coprophila]